MLKLTKNTAIFSIAAALLTVQLIAGLDASGKNSQTYDEAVHLAAGYSYYSTGSFEMNSVDHPPLAKLIAAFPMLFIKPDFPSAGHPWRADMQGNQYRIGDFFLYKNRVPAGKILGAGRLAMLLFATIFSLSLFLCVKKSYGSAAGLTALTFWVFYPPATGNSFLITTDYAAAAFFFLAVFSFREALADTNGFFWSAAAGAATGAALASKFSTITLPASLFLASVYASKRGDIAGKTSAKVLIALSAGAAVLWMSYFFGSSEIFLRGLEYTLSSAASRPRASFLLGKYSTGGWYYYFPATVLLKTPLTMIIAAAAFFLTAKNERAPEKIKGDRVGPPQDGKSGIIADGRARTIYLAFPAAVFFAAACFSKIQIGHRHILPIYPFLAMWAGAGAAQLFKKNMAAKIIAVFLVAACAAEFAATRPWHIGYFSYAAGGPSRGHKYLLDSNVDWGQGLGDLAAFLKKRGASEIYLSYFGAADPEYYGIKYFPVGFVSTVERRGFPVNLAAQPRKFLAVSATNLFANYYADKKIFGPLREIKPVYVAAHSIFVYDLTDPRVILYLSKLFDEIGERSEAVKVRRLDGSIERNKKDLIK
ncbi:MAG: glycosyltransferase family 39 protein [Endomicrobiia bacterium]|nr:glycosyltransferase family 39 protein [Endomicrobiia bacterium]